MFSEILNNWFLNSWGSLGSLSCVESGEFLLPFNLYHVYLHMIKACQLFRRPKSPLPLLTSKTPSRPTPSTPHIITRLLLLQRAVHLLIEKSLPSSGPAPNCLDRKLPERHVWGLMKCRNLAAKVVKVQLLILKGSGGGGN